MKPGTVPSLFTILPVDIAQDLKTSKHLLMRKNDYLPLGGHICLWGSNSSYIMGRKGDYIFS